METGGLNWQKKKKTVNRVEKLSSMVSDVTTEFAQLNSDNAILKVHIRDMQHLLAAQSNMETAAGTLVFRTRGYVTQGRPCKQSTFSTGEDCLQPKNPENTTSSSQKPTAASAAVQVSTNKKWGSADVIRSSGKPAEDGFIAMIWKKSGGDGADKTSDNNKIARQFRTLCTEYEILLV